MSMQSAAHPSSLLVNALVAPWRTVHRSLRWLGGVFSLLLCVAALACGVLVHGRHGWLFGTALYAFGAGYFWMTVMACLLLVCIDARRTCLPGIQRTLMASVLLYALLTTVMPLAMFLPVGGDAVTLMLVAALAGSVGLASALLPRRYVMLIGFLPALAIGARHAVRIPFPGQPGFAALGLALLAIFAAVDAIRWRQWLRADAAPEAGMGSAMVMEYRRHGAMSGAIWNDAARQDDARPTGKASPLVRLGGVGPQAPVLALRVALGERYMPQSLHSHARRFARLGLPLLLFIPAMAVMQAGEAHGDVLHKVLQGTYLNVMVWLGLMGGMALMAMGCVPPWARWRRANAELPLLALLPGLGDGAAQRRHLLRAVLTRPLAMQALLLALVLAAALAMRVGPLALAFVALTQLGYAATVVATTLRTFGGVPLPGWGMAGLLTGMAVLTIASSFTPLLMTHGSGFGDGALLMLTAGWIATAIGLSWLGLSGWQALRYRPHPFLAN